MDSINKFNNHILNLFIINKLQFNTKFENDFNRNGFIVN